MAEVKRTRRTKDELLKAIDAKIEAENKRHTDALAKLKAEKERLSGTTLTKAQKQKKVNDAIKAAGLSPEELVKKLGLKVDFE